MVVDEKEVGSDPIEVYWAPGCSSCLRMKEFIEKTGFAYDEVNVQEQPERAKRLEPLGLGVPAVVVGDRGVPGLDLTGIAELIGFSYDAPAILAPAVLKEKYDAIMAALCRFIAQIPVEGLEYRSPDRDRSFRALCSHAGSIMTSFVEAWDQEYIADGQLGPIELRQGGTTADLVEHAGSTLGSFDAWWERFGFDDPFDSVHGSVFGHRTLLEIFERSVWHTAQHTRQVELFLDRLGIAPDGPLVAELDGLPLPERVQA